VHPLPQPVLAPVETAGAVGLGNQGIEAQEQAHTEDPIARNTMLPSPTAPMAAGPSGPTINVSTSPMVVQPISARMTGAARLTMGLSSLRMPDSIGGIISQ